MTSGVHPGSRLAKSERALAEAKDEREVYDRQAQESGAALERVLSELDESQFKARENHRLLNDERAAHRQTAEDRDVQASMRMQSERAHEQTRAELEREKEWRKKDALICTATCKDNVKLRADLATAQARVAELEADRVVELEVRTRFATRTESAESALASARELLERWDSLEFDDGLPEGLVDDTNVWVVCNSLSTTAPSEPAAMTEARELLEDAEVLVTCYVDYEEDTVPWLERRKAWLQRYPKPAQGGEGEA